MTYDDKSYAIYLQVYIGMTHTTFRNHIQNQNIFGHFKFGSKDETNQDGHVPSPSLQQTIGR